MNVRDIYCITLSEFEPKSVVYSLAAVYEYNYLTLFDYIQSSCASLSFLGMHAEQYKIYSLE